MYFSKSLVLILLLGIGVDSSAQLQPGKFGKNGVSSMISYLSAVKSFSENLLYDVITKENLMVAYQDLSNGDSTSLTAGLQIIQADTDARIYYLYNDLRVTTNAFINGVESDLISSNKLSLKGREQLYDSIILQINSILNNLDDYKHTNFDPVYKSFVKRVKHGKEAVGTSTPFSLTSLIPDPLTFITEVVSIFQAKRDFRSQQIQSICTILDSQQLSTVSDVANGTNPGGSGSQGKQGQGGGTGAGANSKKKGRGK